ncbi:DAN domain family member 5 [Hypomesus transpacificus]|uniref:DAN domain family member 5 n=1 Tax=Hypomesus transpacificus TaxID=137520 RepID=UPI001F07DB7E|nr:DAN domain family member 5 [Hypomesus transpacificus]
MNALMTFVFLPAVASLAFPFPRHGFRPFGKRTHDFDSSGNGPDDPSRGIVKVVKLDLHHSAHPGVFRRGLVPRTVPSSRVPFPAFLAMGRPGPALPAQFAVPPLPHLRRESQSGLDVKKKQGLAMWQKAMNKGDHGKMSMPLPVTLKDAGKQTCTAVPFTHRVTDDGCDSVTVHNNLCFGQCSSLFVPSEGEFVGLSGPGRGRAPCSRCAPSKARTVVVPLRCGTGVRERRVMVVEECKCETGREQGKVEASHM